MGGGDLDLIDINLQFLCHHLCHFNKEALTHLGSAMIELDTAVFVDVQQRACLVKDRVGKRNSEFHGR